MVYSSLKKKKIARNDKSSYVRNSKITQCRIDDCVFLIDPDTDRVFYLDALSTGIWHLLEKPMSMSDAANIVQKAFPYTCPGKVAKDVLELINQMRRKNLVLKGA
jgi:hypothetical protein